MFWTILWNRLSDSNRLQGNAKPTRSGWDLDTPVTMQDSLWHSSQTGTQCPTMSQNVPQCPTMSYNVPQCPTISHKVPQYPTISHNISQGPTRSHNDPQCLIRSHRVPQYPTMSHNVPFLQGVDSRGGNILWKRAVKDSHKTHVPRHRSGCLWVCSNFGSKTDPESGEQFQEGGSFQVVTIFSTFSQC